MALSTNADYIDLLIGRLGRRSTTQTTLRALVVDEINSSLRELERGRFLPWFLETVAILTTVADDRTITLPTGFLREIENQSVEIIASSTVTNDLIKLRVEDLNTLYKDDAAGLPARYAIGEPSIYWGPKPDAAYAVSFPYIAESTAVPDDAVVATNPWLINAHNFVLSHAGIQVAGFHLQNQKLAELFGAATARGRLELVGHHEAREHTNMDYSDADKLVGVR